MRAWVLVVLSAALLLTAISLPLLMAEQWKSLPEESPESPSPSPSPVQRTAFADDVTAFTALIDGEAQNVTMAEYLPLVIAAEMPASFELEALKAQAVAARTYILYKMENGSPAHPEAAVCTEHTCCKAYASENDLRVQWGADFNTYYKKMCRAVSDTDGEYLVYEGEVIQSVFHAASSGSTEDCENVWSSQPYLVSVSTPETADTVTDLVTAVRVSPADFASTLAVDGAVLDGDPAGWVGERKLNSTGRVESVEIGGVTFTGTELRSLFSLRSADFELAYDGTDIVFTVRGYGHGVGMSQQGANLMALSGDSYRDILLHYYSGVELIPGEKSVQ